MWMVAHSGFNLNLNAMTNMKLAFEAVNGY
jgi:hypothetical protein